MSAAYETVAGFAPMVTVGSGESVPDCAVEPLTTGVDVGPNPLAYSTRVSPGLAGVVYPLSHRSKPPPSERDTQGDNNLPATLER